MKIISRTALFKKDVRSLLAKIAGGSSAYKKYLAREADKLADDLAKIKMVPRAFRLITADIVIAYVDYLKKCHYADKTISNKVAVIRRLANSARISLIIPGNKALQIKLKPFDANLPAISRIIDPKKIKLRPIRRLCELQFLFGLKKIEAILFDRSMIHPGYIEVPRSISYNKKDRIVPIASERQKQVLASFKRPGPEKALDRRVISSLHQNILKNLDIDHPEYFRYCYALNRHDQLSISLTKKQILKMLRKELGYYYNASIKDILSCRKNS